MRERTLLAFAAFLLYHAVMKIYLATGNKDKKREAQALFKGHEIVIPADEGMDFHPVEDGSSFMENSIIKAKALFDIVHAPVIADDSGICADALGGRPGIYSARYGHEANPSIDQDGQNRMLINEINISGGKRTAHYTCAMVLYLGADRLFAAQETMEGEIVGSIDEARGEGGFGYDPIFYLPQYGKTAAELTEAEKNAISHRGKAARIIAHVLSLVTQ